MVFRRRREQPQQPAPELTGPWRAAMQRITAAHARFDAAVARTPPGPLRDRLAGLGAEVAATVESALRLALRGQGVRDTVFVEELEDVGNRLKDARRRGADEEVALLSQQFASLNRIVNGEQDLHENVERLALRIETAVAHALELTLLPDAQDTTGRIDGVLDELTALRSAMAELG